jgi:hypothetical protein
MVKLTFQPVVVAGKLQPKVGDEIAFQRVFLELRNGGTESVGGLRLRLEARQGADVICEIDEPLEGELVPGASRRWDLYDLFMERGRGLPSKVHLFGVKAALNWDFLVRAALSGPGTAVEAAFRFTWSGDPAGPVSASLGDLP